MSSSTPTIPVPMNPDHVIDKQREEQPRLLGFWVFLMSDALIFALLFAVYATMIHATDGGPTGKQLFNLKASLIETLLLLVSSFTFGMASLNVMYRPQRLRLLVGWLGVTLALGLAFLAMELNDFRLLIAQGASAQRSGFLSAFYALVSTHGLHVTAGCVWLLLMLVQLKVFGLDARVRLRLKCLALFWHFLDVIWVAIYGIVYLQGLI
ncbi:cytochrome o ubiquinol oxidase subunit III [Pseudomonas sp. Bc-h]|uniref:cytochrome c oxidase subunit 3 n=1 Tax=Pseudomonas sp. Bc-h TaxID=1943632 RepID=UPI0009D9FF34|nr:cytochrome c oxidase subunit 3 [Pseudomonas sp. Bc-h]OQR31651.1 cytochrome o ubiquinol oxidase subunit III [Pseudomonas sp. Bc-h]